MQQERGALERRQPLPGSIIRSRRSPTFDTINGLPGVLVESPRGLVQTTAFEIEGGVIEAIYIVRNPDKLRHLA